jgi:phospholipid/cholesterol/gamma-HCH transport system substrate-binding protein
MGWLRRRQEVPYSMLLRGRRPLRVAVVFLVLLAIAIYFGVAKSVPFTHGYRLNAVFPRAIDIAPGTPVRIAGVNVGQTTGLKRYGDAAEVGMEISESGLPIHRDATVKIRPRLFLEGNWFVELQPGSPGSPSMPSGSTIPITHASDPVQLEQVLDALNTETRSNLQTFLIEYGKALAEKPTAAQNAEQEPYDRGLNAAQALDQAARHAPAATRDSAIVNQALAGTHERDLSALVSAVRRVSAALNVHSQELAELIVNFNAFLEAFANRSAALSATAARLPGALHSVTRAFTALDAAYPSIRAFSEAIVPGVEQTPPTVKAFLPWIAQVRGLLAPSELGGIAVNLRKSAPPLNRLVRSQISFLHQNDLFSQCLVNVLIPAGNVKLQDGANTSGETAFREFWYGLVGQNSIGQSFTGNGLSGLRSLVSSGGGKLTSAQTGIAGQRSRPGGTPETLVSRSPLPPLGTRPRFSTSEPPYRPLVPCYEQKLPEFNGPLASGPADGSGG